MQDFMIENGRLTVCNVRGGIVHVPQEVTEICNNLFRGLPIFRVCLPNGLRRIGDSAFADCRNLESVLVPDSVNEIEPYAFSQSGLRAITLPLGLKQIPVGLCSGCDRLAEITIPDGVEVIGERAFAGCRKLREIRIPYGVTKLEQGTFADCTALRKITIPDTVLSIDLHAFDGCVALQAFSVDANNPNYFSDDAGALFAKDGTLLRYPCAGVQTAYTVPNGVTHIADSAFAHCGTITDVQMADSVLDVGDNAFQHCKRLHSVQFGCGVRRMGEGVFAFSSKLEQVLFRDGMRALPAWSFAECAALEQVRFPADLERIGERAFSGCKSIREIALPQGLVEIGQQAFYGCSKLTAVTIPPQVRILSDSTFAYCKALDAITVPVSVETIEAGAFANCTALQKVRYTADKTQREGLHIDRIGNKRLLEAQWQYKEAEELFNLLSQTPSLKNTDGRTQAQKADLQWPSEGAEVFFGKYPQSTDGQAEPIQWRVLKTVGDKALLISEKALDCKPYNENMYYVIWESCTLRQWLNDTFLKTAFSEAEQEQIARVYNRALEENPKYPPYREKDRNDVRDKIFLLTINDVKRYFPEEERRICEPTPYVKSKNKWTSYTGNGAWWLRNTGQHYNYAVTVGHKGTINLDGVITQSNNHCVRPALWVKL